MLYLVATPIGHLEDITQRALAILRGCDAILCEDTRRSQILLQRYEIKKPLISYHKFKEKQLLHKILEDLEMGKTLALISDSGTPCIQDPGLKLVQACIARGLAFTAIPGPCSLIQALLLSGMETERFQFLGFLPKKGERMIRQALNYPGTTVAFESPERLVKTLALVEKLDATREIAVVREMTKVFEECRRGTAKELRAHFSDEAPRGEIALVITEGILPEALPLEELIAMLQETHGLPLKEAIRIAARLRKQPKREIYRSQLQ